MLPALASELGLDESFGRGGFESQPGTVVEIVHRVDELLDPSSNVLCNCTRPFGIVESRQLLKQAFAPLEQVVELLIAARNRRRIGADLLEYPISLAPEAGPDRVPCGELPIQRCIHGVSSSSIAPVCGSVYSRLAFGREIGAIAFFAESSFTRAPRQGPGRNCTHGQSLPGVRNGPICRCGPLPC